ncbi:S8 family serine peptidase [bacterium]|nr:S8 family serine peptidase [bacterium]
MNNKFILGTALLFSQISEAAINKSAALNFKPNKIVIAVIDTGVDINHRDLKNIIWTNPGETGKDIFGRDKSTNGIDDDGNGYADDLHGWNFVNNSNDVSDSHGHGTHIAGIIQKEYRKHTPSSTSPPPARLMVLKYYSPDAQDSENVLNTVRAIEYANRMEANIINYSGGGGSAFTREYKAIEKSMQKNILFIAAAGNNNSNTDNKKYYPASYELDNIISVAATDNDGEFVSFSNYGQKSIDIAAPGKMIYSALPNNNYGFMSGTSQATAYVTGVAASLIAKSTSPLKTQEVLIDLLATSKFSKSLKGKTKFQLAMVK